MSQPPIAVIGAGSFGTALALHLSRLKQAVHLWSYDQKHIEQMLAEKCNTRYFPDVPFPPSLHPTFFLDDAIKDVKDILIAVPSHAFRDTLLALKPILKPHHRILWATKGLDQESGQLLHTLATEILGNNHSYATLSGPSYAGEIVLGLPTAVVIASHDEQFAKELVARFNAPTFRTYLSNDMIGVEIGGVVKNVLAIAIGISDGMGFGANTRSALITRGLAEMIRLGLALGGKLETFIGLSGVGDLILTCTDNQSRNRRFGLALGKGKTVDEATQAINQVVEGKRNAELVVQLAEKNNIEMPISECVLAILQQKISLKEALEILLTREPKIEN